MCDRLGRQIKSHHKKNPKLASEVKGFDGIVGILMENISRKFAKDSPKNLEELCHAYLGKDPVCKRVNDTLVVGTRKDDRGFSEGEYFRGGPSYNSSPFEHLKANEESQFVGREYYTCHYFTHPTLIRSSNRSSNMIYF